MALESFKTAEQDIDAQKRAMLAAVAERGSAGLAEFDAQARAVQAAREQAMATVQPSQPGVQDVLNSRLGAVADIYAQDVEAGRASLGREGSRISAANAAYGDQVRQAIPIVQAQTEQDVAGLKAQLIEKQMNAESRRRLDEIQLAKSMASLQKEQTKEFSKPASLIAVAKKTGIPLQTVTANRTADDYKSLRTILDDARNNGLPAEEAWNILTSVVSDSAAAAKAALGDTATPEDEAKTEAEIESAKTIARQLWEEYQHTFEGERPEATFKSGPWNPGALLRKKTGKK